jgi:hypothetical protein
LLRRIFILQGYFWFRGHKVTWGQIGREGFMFLYCVYINLAETYMNESEMLFLLQTALSIFFQEAAISSSPQGPGTHFGQVSSVVGTPFAKHHTG